MLICSSWVRPRSLSGVLRLLELQCSRYWLSSLSAFIMAEIVEWVPTTSVGQSFTRPLYLEMSSTCKISGAVLHIAFTNYR